jgi:hypothetical protein
LTVACCEPLVTYCNLQDGLLAQWTAINEFSNDSNSLYIGYDSNCDKGYDELHVHMKKEKDWVVEMSKMFPKINYFIRNPILYQQDIEIILGERLRANKMNILVKTLDDIIGLKKYHTRLALTPSISSRSFHGNAQIVPINMNESAIKRLEADGSHPSLSLESPAPSPRKQRVNHERSLISRFLLSVSVKALSKRSTCSEKRGSHVSLYSPGSKSMSMRHFESNYEMDTYSSKKNNAKITHKNSVSAKSFFFRDFLLNIFSPSSREKTKANLAISNRSTTTTTI